MDAFSLKIRRSGGKYDSFEVEGRPGMTVLEALFHVQDRLDPSLAFRYSCRGAVCGSCAMLINRFPGLACRTQAAEALKEVGDEEFVPCATKRGGMFRRPGAEILVEPLPNLPVIKDLVVDMGPFFEAYRKVEPVFAPVDADPEKERLMDPAEVRELEGYTNCILCACCYGACPVEGEESPFLGPAAMAKLYRFVIDPREGRPEERLKKGDGPDGWPACRFHTKCRKVCPKGVAPNLAIGQARSKLSEKKSVG